MFLADSWTDYEVLDTGDGEKLERWGEIILRRPDPQTIWPDRWTVCHENLKFFVRPTGFKHTGLFPEQAANWIWMSGLIRKDGRKDLKILNLFGYTGGATLACAAAGAHVTHVDAAKGMVLWAKENRELSGLPETSFRWIVEDALRFVQREIRRGNHYDGILMDPPSYGRGPSGEVWKLENELYGLIDTCAQVLSEEPLFFLINSYTTGFQASVLSNMLGTLPACDHGRRTALRREREVAACLTSCMRTTMCWWRSSRRTCSPRKTGPAIRIC